MISPFFATSYPGGPAALFAGFAWIFVGAVSAVVALVALGLAPFSRTARAAGLASQLALRGGLLAMGFALIAAVFIVLDEGIRSPGMSEIALQFLFTGIVPAVALGAEHLSRRKQPPQVDKPDEPK
jgi:hypothetical protein